ncbi:MAG: acetyltransferase [Amycolatopsis sp.]|jgi:GNAT superfamily N-acetyltransferase|uniref:GNAT family N-acetyltransferase n=1 Tax=Amycolatopsis sp. TaxID=37632 RepID=UPI00261455CD|nr:GNAT family N-acetyltransferase [Amycolatopsis sp.]MCU1686465.1 acetyltransferase [Amycolatopsis sp.]
MDIRVATYDDPDALKLIAEVQQEYIVRYGDIDETPVDVAEFTLPQGLFLIGYLDNVPVACGAWRAHDGPSPYFRPGDAELKRMYVSASVRGRGFARAVLAELERTAAERGRTRSILETGTAQPEAIALYESSGYTPIRKFGHYKEDSRSICFGKALTDS